MVAQAEEGHLVICVDGSKYTHNVTAFVKDHIDLSRYSKVTVLSMVPDHTIDFAMYGPEFVLDYRRKAEAKALEVVHGVRDQLGGLEVAHCLVALGPVKEGLLTMLNSELKANLIVMGSHGHGGFKRAFLGSVSDYIVHHAKVPVLIVKPKEA